MRNLDRESVLHPVVAVAVSTAVYSLILIGADDLLGLPVPPPAVAAQLIAAAAVYNAALIPLALVVARKLHAPPLTRRIEPT
jgi:hypothetical protein